MIQDDGNLFAIAGHPWAAWTTWLGLRAMRHRAQGAVGLVAADGAHLAGLWATGLHDDRPAEPRLDGLRGAFAIGRLSAGLAAPTSPVAPADEPVLRWARGGRHALASAGRLTNGAVLRRHLLDADVPLAGSSGAELVLAALARGHGSTIVSSFVHLLFDLDGAWNLALLAPDLLIVARDPRGFRPLYAGLVDGAPAFASESGALWAVGAGEVREVDPGEVVVVEGRDQTSLRPFPRGAVRRAESLLDLVALARPESEVAGAPCASTRAALGRALAAEQPCGDATMVVGLADALEVAQGYAAACGRPLRATIAVDPPELRAPIPPSALSRVGASAPVRVVGAPDRSVVLAVPTLTTAAAIEPAVRALLRAGVERVHVRVASPPVIASEPYGLALPPPELLLAVRHPTAAEQADRIGAASLGCLSLEAMRAAVPAWSAGWCDTPWTRALPIPADVTDKQVPIPFPARADA
jgi:amidophosphoribosyltransferase